MSDHSAKQALYCVNEAQYSGVLSYGCVYETTGLASGQVEAILPNGRRRKFPREVFSENPPPKLLNWKLDDEILDPSCCYVEVQCDLGGGDHRWVAFVTPRYLELQLPRTGDPCWVQRHLVIVTEVSLFRINESLQWLLRQGLIVEHSLPLGNG